VQFFAHFGAEKPVCIHCRFWADIKLCRNISRLLKTIL